ncbi:MAG TPA: hypothetical protein VGS41_19540, partial [Chthonomonadales bacterium]|nr:hypothetical protein [Chthonomonadales bacterium]
AQLTYLRPNLLILDEPTNHLDLDSREALARMLREYDGTLLLVSHDRYLLDQVTNRTIYVANGGALLFDGPYSEMRIALQCGKLKAYCTAPSDEPAAGALSAGGASLESLLQQKPGKEYVASHGLNFHQLAKERQRAAVQIKAAEARVSALEERLKEIERALSYPGQTDDQVALSQEHGGVQRALEEAIVTWESAVAHAELLGAV